MTTVSCDVFRGGGRGIRASINGQQFVECGVFRGGSLGPSVLVGSSKQILNVKTWTPAQDDEGVDHGHTVKANIEAVDTNEKDVLYATESDFDAGVYTDTEVDADELVLATSPASDDFESYTPGANPIGDGWTNRTSSQLWDIDNTIPGSVQCLREYVSATGIRVASFDDGPNASDVDVKVRVRWSADSCSAAISARLTGSGSALRGYKVGISHQTYNVDLSRYTGDGSTFLIKRWLFTDGSHLYPQANTWYWIRYKIVGNDHSFKAWQDGSAEPDTWLTHSDGTHPGPGGVGVDGTHGLLNRKEYFDDFTAESIPPAYASAGSWEDAVDVSSVGNYSHGLVSWDETTPTDTTVAVKARWSSDDAWVAQTNGERITGIGYGEAMIAGSTKTTMQLMVELTTTDPISTPSVGNLQVYFEPAAEEAFKLTVHGVENIVADGSLLSWGREWLSSGSGQPYLEASDWSDITIMSIRGWIGNDRETITAAFSYWGNAVESITFEAAESKFRLGYLPASWLVPGISLENAPSSWSWTPLREWFPLSHTYDWHLIDTIGAAHGDARWFVGHYRLDNHPGSLLCGVVGRFDHPGEVLVKGYARDGILGALLVQGFRWDDQRGMVLPAIQYQNEYPGMVIVATVERGDHPGQILVYGVNRDGAIFVNVIDDATYQALLDEGITFG